MSESKEFQGKNLDEAIEAACRHFDLKRDKLEIEIVSGGSSGIFGLVGVKKAVVRAKPRGSFKLEQPEPERRAEKAERPRREPAAPKAEPAKAEPAPQKPQAAPAPVAEAAPAMAAEAPEAGLAVEAAPAAEAPADAEGQEQGGSRRSRGRRGRGRGDKPERSDKPAEKPAEKSGERPERAERSDRGERSERGDREPGRSRRRDRPRREAEAKPPRREANLPAEDEENGAPQGIAHLDPDQLKAVAAEVTGKLLLPLVENAQVSVELLTDRVCVRIEDPDNTGLLIGREGQTLASIQYLVNRLVSKRMESSVRVQIDAGDYRENQDERLRQIARHLADKAMSTGRTQSTRPMSSYHRRVVHLTLQDDEHVFTRSKGEGAMKRVLIMTKRRGKDGELLEDSGADAEPRDMDNSAVE